jgi:hypothetical protein
MKPSGFQEVLMDIDIDGLHLELSLQILELIIPQIPESTKIGRALDIKFLQTQQII